MRNFFLKKLSWIEDLTGAWIFYSILPNLHFCEPKFDRIARFAPVIGIVIGSLQSLLWLILNKFHWPKEACVILAIALGAWLTGGLHIDGLMDTADGLAAGKKRCLKAMRDSTVGAGGVQALIITLLIQIACLMKLGNLSIYILPIATFWGRYAPILAIEKFSYLHPSGTGSFHREGWKGFLNESKPTFISLVIIITLLHVSSVSINSILMVGLILCIPITLTIPYLLGKKLGGHSGDSYGASVVLVETAIMILFSILFQAT
tara:strand:+ start:105 stop:890 length:786 start_codon:yes stop_codon:yes gene_type:complete